MNRQMLLRVYVMISLKRFRIFCMLTRMLYNDYTNERVWCEVTNPKSDAD